MFRELIDVKVNVRIIARERGKLVRSLCREGHNIWVNYGRQYLAEIISPATVAYDAPINGTRVVRYMGVGVGGDSQVATINDTNYPNLNPHYPGQNTYDDETLTRDYLERPVKVSGTAGVGTSAGVWLKDVSAPPTLGGTPTSNTTFVATFSESDLHLSGAYPSVPLSEIGLMLSDEVSSRQSNEVYDYLSSPAYINSSGRQKVIAYNTFDTISKTSSVALEFHWQIQF